jgi:hypothetical protein
LLCDCRLFRVLEIKPLEIEAIDDRKQKTKDKTGTKQQRPKEQDFSACIFNFISQSVTYDAQLGDHRPRVPSQSR